MSVHGVSKNADLDPSLLEREIRPLRMRIGDFFADTGGMMTMLLGLAVVITPFFEMGTMSDFLIIIGFIVYFLAKKYQRGYPHRRPMDPAEPDPKTGKVGDGIILIGNDKDSNEMFWISNDDARTHMLVFGSTGSGKTRFLLSLFYQALLLGSGVMYVDGKGDTTVFGMVYAMCRRLGREDDLLVINYLTGSKSGPSVDDGSRLSNTNNPFAYGPSETLRSLIVSLMSDSGGGADMWKERASALLAALLQMLVFLRDRGDIILDVDMIRNYLPLDKIVELTQRDDISEDDAPLLKKYLVELPGYNEDDALSGDINPKAYEQHGYLVMQLTGVLSELSSTYKHIFGAPLGEVDYKDLVYNRRILFVMLPALEKDPDALAGLGKLVVAGVRSALAPALGEKVEGSHEEVIEAKPTNSDVPFLLIMDEYGYYSVKGFSVVAAQARSLGMSVIFAGQDFPSFKKGSEDEAKSVVANTNVKIFMKLEDQGETLQLAVERGGEGETVQAAGHEVKGDLISGYADNQQTRSERRKRVNIRDLVNQKPGEAHVMFGDKLVRCRLYFTNPETPPEYRINRMLMVNKPSDKTIKRLTAAQDNLIKIFKNKEPDESRMKNIDLDQGIRALFSAYEVAIERNQEPVMASKLAFGMMEYEEQLLDDDFVLALKGKKPESLSADAKGQADKESRNEEKASASPVQEKLASRAEKVLAEIESSDESDDMDEALEASLSFIQEGMEPDESIREEVSEIFNSLSQLIHQSIEGQLDEADPVLSPYEKEKALPIHQLASIEKEFGLDEEDALSEAIRGLGIIDEQITYPSKPIPDKMSSDVVDNTLEIMLKQIARQQKN